MWKLLKATEDWIAHKQSILADCDVPDGFFDFGAGPAAYPCLADTLIPVLYQNGSHLLTDPEPPQQIRLRTAFVYQRDAALLLATKEAPLPVVSLQAKQQSQFNCWIAASVLTIARYLTTTGLCAPREGLEANQTAYERVLEEMLQKVSSLKAEQIEDTRILTEHERAVLRASDGI